jgi:N-methylhydantoinase A
MLRTLEMRFRHQVHQVKVPAPNGVLGPVEMDRVVERFIALYEQNFGRGTAVIEAGVEILTFHVMATTHHTTLRLVEAPIGGADAGAACSGSRPVYFDGGFVETPVYEHDLLVPGNKIVGPAILEGRNTTMPLHPGQELTVDPFNNLTIRFAGFAA